MAAAHSFLVPDAVHRQFRNTAAGIRLCTKAFGMTGFFERRLRTQACRFDRTWNYCRRLSTGRISFNARLRVHRECCLI